MSELICTILGELIIKLGESSVGACTIPGLYDPEIPEKLKEEHA